MNQRRNSVCPHSPPRYSRYLPPRCLTPTVHAAQPTDSQQSAWNLDFTENPKLPSAFREFAVPRPDGTIMRAYLANIGPNADARDR